LIEEDVAMIFSSLVGELFAFSAKKKEELKEQLEY